MTSSSRVAISDTPFGSRGRNSTVSGLARDLSHCESFACIAFKQPISQAETDRLFEADKRAFVVKRRDLKLVEEFAGDDGRLHFATTQAFLQCFGLEKLAGFDDDLVGENLSQWERKKRKGAGDE